MSSTEIILEAIKKEREQKPVYSLKSNLIFGGIILGCMGLGLAIGWVIYGY